MRIISIENSDIRQIKTYLIGKIIANMSKVK